MPEPATPIEHAYAIAVSLRGSLFELAQYDDRSAEQIRERAAELAHAVGDLADLLKLQIPPAPPAAAPDNNQDSARGSSGT